MSGINLTSQEIENIYKTYANYGESKLAEFVQAIWKEAFEEGYDKAVKDNRSRG
jgi:hypothetical protein